MMTATAIVPLLLLRLCVSQDHAGPARSEGEISLSVKLSRDGIQAGSSEQAALQIVVVRGWHINSSSPADENLVPTSAAFTSPPGLRVTDVRYPGGISKKFSFSDTPLDVYEGTVVIRLNVTAAPGLATGSYEISSDVSYQACNDNVCLPPATARVIVPVRVLAADVSPRPANPELFEEPNHR